MREIVRSQDLPSCSRCGGDRLLTTPRMPMKDASGQPIELELCEVCDADKPAAAALIAFFTEGGGHDVSRSTEGARLLMEWTKEGMADHGWSWVERPSPSLN
ncbi:DUF6300 family protein [Streptomyces sp. NPDC005345]|uniref:DUF6300 family protein n=1 Tax=Streptomyces sp. NPDC005345 TaxID=3156877 RepID=UPI0033B930CA